MAPRTRRIIKFVFLAAVSVVVGFVLHRCYRHLRGIEVCLNNVDTQPLRSGQLTIRSRKSTKTYLVGDLTPAASACIWVKADNEASVDVTFTLTSGAPKVIPLNGYIESGYSGSISAEVTGEGVRSIKADIDFF